MDKEYLFKLKDGFLISFDIDNWCESSGCETCNFGSEYINECNIIFSDYLVNIKISEMYEYAISTDFWIKLFCQNCLIFTSMTQKEVINFIENKIKEIDTHYDNEFNVIKK